MSEGELPEKLACCGLVLFAERDPNDLGNTIYHSKEHRNRGPIIVHRLRLKPEDRWTGVVYVGGRRIEAHGGSPRNITEKLQKSARRELEFQQHLWTWGAKSEECEPCG